MGSMGIDGLISGLDTTSLINSLMQAEAAPQTLLKSKQSSTTTMVSALQSLNTKVASLAEAATKAATAASWGATKATTSATSVTASTTNVAQATALTFQVDKVAQNQISLSDAFTSPTALTKGASTVTIKVGNTLTEVAVGTDPAAFAKAISGSDAGVNAVAVTVGTDTRLQLTGKSTGKDAAFTVYAGTKADVEAELALGTATKIDLIDSRVAQDAQVTLWPGSVGQVVTSKSNTFSDVLSGTSFTVSKVEADPVTLTVARDTAALTSLASGLVGSLGVVISEISSRTSTTTSTDADGHTVVKGGLFSGDSAVRQLQTAVSSAASYPIDGISPSSVGIVVGSDGTFTFDSAKFAAALDKDPAQVQKVVAGIAKRVADVAKGTSDSISGTLTLKITGQQKELTGLNDQIEDWDRRLALRRESLQTTYSNLEVTLSGLKSQSSWLSGQLAALG
ncbi:flagellar filament capping protein FliD [Cellulomonas sp. URHD0024]|uniref:flagellar filament capping protein FliD n=1 Tax=Cellulomonas sp. URHD0024 TaxID=1302620 RepID=UPI00047F768B|nr:flagellar filament capping protein FliD [Cellulomonas sp. URHD0024]